MNMAVVRVNEKTGSHGAENHVSCVRVPYLAKVDRERHLCTTGSASGVLRKHPQAPINSIWGSLDPGQSEKVVAWLETAYSGEN